MGSSHNNLSGILKLCKLSLEYRISKYENACYNQKITVVENLFFTLPILGTTLGNNYSLNFLFENYILTQS